MPKKNKVTTPSDLRAEIADLKSRLAKAEFERDQALRRINTCESSDLSDLYKLSMIIVDNSPAVLFRRRADEDAELVYISENVRQWGWCAGDFMSGKVKFADHIYPDDLDRLHAEITKYDEQDAQEYVQEYRIITKCGEVRWVRDRTTTVRDDDGKAVFRQGLVIDIHESKEAELALARNEERFRRTLETAGDGYVFMDKDLRILEVNDACCNMLGYERSELLGKMPTEFASDSYRRYQTTHKEALLSMEYRRFESEVVTKNGKIVPVLVNGNTLRDSTGKALGNVAFITDLTEQKKALLLAEEVQKSLLPSLPPRIPGLDIAGRSVSCENIGGDYFDYFDAMGDSSEIFGAVVGDISGHGLDAALLMTTARAFLRMRASKPGTLSEVVTDMNRYLAADLHGSGRFMTLFSLLIDLGSGTVCWVKAGHDPALVYSPQGGEFRELEGEGLPLGVLPDTRYAENCFPLFEQDHITVVGTDGIWEARNTDGEMFGKERFKKVVRDHADCDARTILDAVYAAVDDFSSGLRPRDDITLVVIKNV